MTPPRAPAPGHRFPGFAEVTPFQATPGLLPERFHGRESATGRPVTLEVVVERGGDPGPVREAVQALASLPAHPNLVSVLKAVPGGDGVPVVVLEHCSESLWQRLDTPPAPVRSAAAVARLGTGLADALHLAHEAGVLHGWLQPGAVLATGRGMPALAGFGAAEVPAADDVPAAYLAPERRRGEPASVAADVYGIAAVLTRLLTGDEAWTAPEAPPEVTPEARLGARHPPERQRAAVLRVLTGALSEAPEWRPASAGRLAELLRDTAATARHAAPEAPAAPEGCPSTGDPAHEQTLSGLSGLPGRRLTLRSGSALLRVDATGLRLRSWHRRATLPWPEVLGFEAIRDERAGGGATGRLVAVTRAGHVELPATRRPVAELASIHALLEASRRWAGGG